MVVYLLWVICDRYVVFHLIFICCMSSWERYANKFTEGNIFPTFFSTHDMGKNKNKQGCFSSFSSLWQVFISRFDFLHKILHTVIFFSMKVDTQTIAGVSEKKCEKKLVGLSSVEKKYRLTYDIHIFERGLHKLRRLFKVNLTIFRYTIMYL